jgi:putative ABC transport system substrate-binding protein
MAERILQGADPAVTPVETQKELLLDINLTAARNMGVTVPKVLLDRANTIY